MTDTGKASAAERAYTYTRQQILSGAFAAGDLISEGEIASATALSRTPVREAFLRLQTEGALRLHPKRGALVVPVSVAEIQQVLQARLLIEAFAAEQVIAADADTRAELAAELTASMHRQQELAAAGDHTGFVAEDRTFHELIVRTAGNDLLADFYDVLRDRQLRMGSHALRRTAERRHSIAAQHARLAELIATGTTEQFRQAAEEHLRGTREALLGLPV
ncbi:DNA-binding GntR family transcriptional regulator [Catenulispora sp. GP43]|uniref:GntR family transcriptional regulator n=1 Tax=Catenulispora sp. GP43 TaxID=3156263 RepID=UPI003516B301